MECRDCPPPADPAKVKNPSYIARLAFGSTGLPVEPDLPSADGFEAIIENYNKKRGPHSGSPFLIMAPREGFEPPTRWLTATCSAS